MSTLSERRKATRDQWHAAARLTWAIRCAKIAGTENEKTRVSDDERAMIDAAISAGSVTRCPAGYPADYRPKVLQQIGVD